MTTFSAFPKKSLQSISFELSKGSLERELLCYQKRVRILRLFGRRWKQQSHGSRLPHRGLCESRKPEKKVQTQFTSWIQNILNLWISAKKIAVFWREHSNWQKNQDIIIFTKIVTIRLSIMPWKLLWLHFWRENCYPGFSNNLNLV